MIVIIPEKRKIRCWRCCTLISFHNSDVKKGEANTYYIPCPKCGAQLTKLKKAFEA